MNMEGKEETKSLEVMTRICLPLHCLNNEMYNNHIVQKRYHSAENINSWSEVSCFGQNEIMLNIYTQSIKITSDHVTMLPTANDH